MYLLKNCVLEFVFKLKLYWEINHCSAQWILLSLGRIREQWTHTAQLIDFLDDRPTCVSYLITNNRFNFKWGMKRYPNTIETYFLLLWSSFVNAPCESNNMTGTIVRPIFAPMRLLCFSYLFYIYGAHLHEGRPAWNTTHTSRPWNRWQVEQRRS